MTSVPGWLGDPNNLQHLRRRALELLERHVADVADRLPAGGRGVVRARADRAKLREEPRRPAEAVLRLVRKADVVADRPPLPVGDVREGLVEPLGRLLLDPL